MNRLLWLALCVLYVQALKDSTEQTTVENDVEASTYYAVQTRYPEDNPPPGIGESGNAEFLKEYQEEYKSVIEKYYNEVYNAGDEKYSILAKIRFSRTTLIPGLPHTFYLTMVRMDCPKSNGPKCNGRKLAAYDCKVSTFRREVTNMNCLK